jgi:hypothetical protein
MKRNGSAHQRAKVPVLTKAQAEAMSFEGVYRNPRARTRPWTAQVMVAGKSYWIACDTEARAAEAYRSGELIDWAAERRSRKPRRRQEPSALKQLANTAALDGGRWEEALVMEAQRLELTWADIATALGRDEKVVWQRWHVDGERLEQLKNACTAETGFAFLRPGWNYYTGAHHDDPDYQRRYVLRRLRELRDDRNYWTPRIGGLVDQAREQGSSWTGIGQALGISHQAARARYDGKRKGT